MEAGKPGPTYPVFKTNHSRYHTKYYAKFQRSMSTNADWLMGREKNRDGYR